MTPNGGPYLLAALICQRAQQDQYGSFSIINVLEQLIVGTEDPKAPEKMPTFRFQAALVVQLASGRIAGPRTLSVTLIEPSGGSRETFSQEVELKGEDHRVTVVSNLSLDATEDGLYWFNIALDGRLLTRVPLRIVYQRGGRMPWNA